MGNPKAFLEIGRQEAGYRPVHDRIHDFGEVEQTLSTRERKLQASRCMDCGVPFCHWACPLGNKAPEWNDALYRGDWELAYRLLNSTNPFPEFTGRICPALCEKACVLNRFNHEPTTNREDECAIIEAAFREGYITPRPPQHRIMKLQTPPLTPPLLETLREQAPASGRAEGRGVATADGHAQPLPSLVGEGPGVGSVTPVSSAAPSSSATVPAGSPAGPSLAAAVPAASPAVPALAPVRVAVIGAGPAGLAAANALNQMGYTVTVFEKNEAAGGLLRYGIPNFKLNKAVIDRRLRLLEEEGIEFRYGEAVKLQTPPLTPPLLETLREQAPASGRAEGRGVATASVASPAATPAQPLPSLVGEGPGVGSASSPFSAVVLATGTPTARDLCIPGRELKGVHFALELLSQQNRVLAGVEFTKEERITAKGKDVLVIGGGDTGSDCIGTAHRQGARSVTQIEIMPRPVEGPDDPQNPWPAYPRTLKTTSSHEEGCTRRWNINTLEFLGKDGKLTGVKVQEIDWQPNPNGGRPLMVEKGQPEIIKAELVLLAMGFLKPEHPQYPENVFVCGDSANGASLVVRALASGIQTAQKVNQYLINK